MTRFTLCTVLVVLGTLAIPATAQNYDRNAQRNQRQNQSRFDQQQQQQQSRQRQMQQQQRQDRMMRQQANQQRQIRGRVLDARTVNLGNKGRHVLAKVLTDDGRTAIVDLGTPQDLRGTRLYRGQRLSAIGKAGRINARPILVADRFRDDARPDAVLVIIRPETQQRQQLQQRAMTARQRGNMDLGQDTGFYDADLDRQQFQDPRTRQQRMMNDMRTQQQRRMMMIEQQRRRMQQQQQQQQQRQPDRGPFAIIRGQIVDTRDVRMEGIPDSHKLVKLQTPAGRTVVVDLGKAKNTGLKDIKLQKGETIAAIGEMGRINDRPVLFADHVADLVTIDRDESAQQASERQRQQQQRDRATTRPSGNAG